jgi:2-polyprenyl-3-methyl-5-hydroxy-6-metoxy-1,4-benzoquinol methylase
MSGGNSDFYKGHLVYSRIDRAVIDQHCRSAAKAANRSLLAMLPKGSRILDFGCSYGAFVRFALQKGFDAYGIDFNDEHIRAGQEVLGLGDRLILGDVMNLPNAKRFNLITLFEVIEHVENPQKLIRKIRELLLERGFLAISCPNEARWQLTGRVFVDYPPHHLTRWRPDTLRRFLEKEGFQHVKTEIESSFSHLLWVLYVNRSAKGKLDHIHTKKNTGDYTRSACTRMLKMSLFNLVKLLCAPFDLGLKAAGIGTLGMQMIVRKV